MYLTLSLFDFFQIDNPRYHNSHTHHLRHQQPVIMQHNSLPNSPNENELGHRRGQGGKSGPNSATTSPISGKRESQREQQQQQQHQSSMAGDGYGYVRTSRSEVIIIL